MVQQPQIPLTFLMLKISVVLFTFFMEVTGHSLTSRDFAFVAEGLVRNGISTVLVKYALCPSVNINEIVR